MAGADNILSMRHLKQLPVYDNQFFSLFLKIESIRPVLQWLITITKFELRDQSSDLSKYILQLMCKKPKRTVHSTNAEDIMRVLLQYNYHNKQTAEATINKYVCLIFITTINNRVCGNIPKLL